MAAATSGRFRKLLPLSVLTFFLYSAIGSLVPFLNLHGRDLGLTSFESFVANCAAAVCCLLFVPCVGLIARKSGRYKTLSVACLVVSSCAYTGLWLMPKSHRTPRHPLMDFDCGEALRMERCSNWDTCSDAATSSSAADQGNTTFTLSGCRYVCRGQRGRRPPPDAAYPLHVCFRSEEGNLCHVQDPTSSQDGDRDDDDNSSSSVTFHSRFNLWYADELPQLAASDFLSHRSPSNTLNTLDHVPIDDQEQESRAIEPEVGELVSACRFRPVYPLVVHGKSYDDVFCRPAPAGCAIRCKVALLGDALQAGSCLDVVGDPVLTFWGYVCARSIADACLLTVVALFESMVLFSVRDFDGLYGRTRIWASVGLALFPPVVGVLVDYYTDLTGERDYSPAFFLFDGLALIVCALTIALRVKVGGGTDRQGRYVVNSPQRRVFLEQQQEREKRPFWSCEMILLVLVVLVLGSFWAILDTFLPPHYEQTTQNKKFQVGLNWTFAFACTVPFLAVSKELVLNIGRSHLLVFAFLFYGIRFAGISFVGDPWWAFPFEAMQAMTLSVTWLASVSYAHFLTACNDVTSRLHLLLLSVHFGLGRVTGCVCGFYLIDSFGLEWTFRGVAICSASLGLCYLLGFHTCMRACREDVARKRKMAANQSASNNGRWLPLVEREQVQRPNGDARLLNHRQQTEPDPQPILMIDDDDEEE